MPYSGPDTCFAVQITTAEPSQTGSDDPTVGLIDGDFRWVTGRPGFTALAPPTGENDGDVWYEGFLNSPEDFGPAVRMIDVTTAGGYGTLQGIKFSIDNTAAFQDYLEDNDIFLANRAVKVYAVMAGVFKQIWAGVVSDMSWDELNYTFSCENAYKRIHKNLPVRKVDAVSFSRADAKVIGSTIPICFGHVQHARLFNIDGRPDAINFSGTGDLRVTVSTRYASIGGVFYLRLKTPGLSLDADAWNGKMLHVVRGDDQSMYILKSLPTAGSGDSAYTDVWLDGHLSGTPGHYTSPPTEDVWWYEVIDQGSAYTPSDAALSKIYEIDDTSKRPVIEFYEAESNEYRNVYEMVREVDLTKSNAFETPYIVLMSNSRQLMKSGGFGWISGNIGTGGQHIYRFVPNNYFTGGAMILVPIVPIGASASGTVRIWEQGLRWYTGEGGSEEIRYLVTANAAVPYDFFSKVLDRSRLTSSPISTVQTAQSLVNSFDLTFPKDKVGGSISSIFILFDANITCSANVTVRIQVKRLDAFGVEFADDIKDKSFTVASGTDVPFNLLPDAYYAGGGNANSGTETSLAQSELDSAPYISYLEMKESDISDIMGGSGISKLRLTVTYSVSGAEQIITVNYKQIGFMAGMAASFRSWDIFAAVQSSIGATVYDAFDKMLKTYDGIAAGSLDLTGVADRRGLTWPVGRQVLDQKNSAEYITELAKQSYVGVFPNRTGKLALKAFREFDTVIKAFDASNVIAGSITKFEKTPNDDVYNEFDIQYAWDEGRKKFMRSLSIANVDAAAFPTELESTGTDADKTFASMVIRKNSSGSWQANILVSAADPTWAVAGAFVSYYGNSNGAAFYYQRISGKYGSGPWTIVVPLDVPPGVYGSWGAVGTLTHHGTGVRKWTTYTSGITDYQLGKQMWDACHNSYQHTMTKRKAPDELSKCYWFPDGEAFADIAGNNSALEYLKALVEWSTRQKDVTQFAVPMRDNLTRELLDFCTFTDAKFTAGDLRQGYVTMVKHDIATCRTILEMILIPADIDSIGDIVESGIAPDTITETGSAADTITETGIGA